MDDVSKAYGAAYHGNLAMLQSFAERNPRILHAHHGGDSLLIRAARGNRGEVVEWLLSQGVDVNEEGFCWGAKTAMMSACYEGHLSMVRLLLSRGAALNHKHDSSWAPIMCAAYKGHTAVVEELLRYVGGDLRKLRAHNEALAYALRNGAVGPVELLLGAGADVTGFERQAGSLRWFWCEKAKAEACRRMLQEWHLRRSITKARRLCDTSYIVSNTSLDHRAKTRAGARRGRVQAAPPHLEARVGRGEALPRVEVKGGKGRGSVKACIEDGMRVEVLRQALGPMKEELFEEMMRMVAP